MFFPRTAAALLLFSVTGLSADTKFDKAKLEAYVRYTEGYTAKVLIAADDPTPSDFAGFSRVVVHLTMGPQKVDKVYFVSSNGQEVVNGTMWDAKASPFADNLAHLPKNGPAFGPADARVTMVVFSDFQCPYCRSFAKELREKLPAKYAKEVRVEFADFPIASIHDWSVPAAARGRCFSQAGTEQFWKFHDWIFEHQGEINKENLGAKTTEFAKTLGKNDRLESCLTGGGDPAAITASLATGMALGVQQTPTFFINGRMIGGALPWDSLEAVIQLELNRPLEVPGPVAERP